jgi:hypothetical protein
MKERRRRINFSPKADFETAISVAPERGASVRDGRAGSINFRRQSSIVAPKEQNSAPT